MRRLHWACWECGGEGSTGGGAQAGAEDKGSGKGQTDSRVSWGIQGARGMVGAASMEQDP